MKFVPALAAVALCMKCNCLQKHYQFWTETSKQVSGWKCGICGEVRVHATEKSK